jgi:hypothetical protein
MFKTKDKDKDIEIEPPRPPSTSLTNIQEIEAQHNAPLEKYLMLGFVQRGNSGDEAFIQPYKILFPDTILVFKSIDDTEEIPSDISVVILIGGDVINDYFCMKIKDLLETFNGPCYAISVGIPFVSQAKYTSIFDHVILRSKQDIPITTKIIGERNVDYLPDITWVLKPLLPSRPNLIEPRSSAKPLRFGICLARPAFFKNDYDQEMINEIVLFIYTLVHDYPKCEINLIAFNSSVNIAESDYITNKTVYDRLSNYPNVKNCVDISLTDPFEMLKFIGTHDIIVGMRFHSIVFSMIQNVPFVSMYSTRKINNLLTDFNLLEFGYKLPVDKDYKPIELKCSQLLELVSKRLNTTNVEIKVNISDYDYIKRIVKQKKRKQIFVKNFYNENFDDMLEKTHEMIKKYLHIDDAQIESWENDSVSTTELLKKTNKDAMNFARLICFGITNKIGVPYLWGLKDNMLKPGFHVTEAIKWIYEDYAERCKVIAESFNYYPIINPEKRIVIDINYMCQDNYSGLHRSGWSYVLSGLQHLDARNVEKPADIIVDTCLERSFLWGVDVTKTALIVPYKSSWVGIIHHTFDTTYSHYNCHTLLNTPEFIDSMPHCKCLFTLSDYLRVRLKKELVAKGIHVPVLCIIHPTEFVSNNFEIGKFVSNKDRKVIHVGAWLRNPYSIYSLPLPSKNRLGITKVALKGKEMDNYFRPDWLFDKMFEILQEYNLIHDGNTNSSDCGYCRPGPPSNSCPPPSNGGIGGPPSSGGMCRPLIVNKYLEGMIEQLKKDDESVTILDFKGDNDFDTLLSENIVFLNLVDASASNTVIECIVRNTPLIINRLPALEEALGPDYPGFYSSLFEAAAKIIDMNHILITHEYIKRLDKTKYHLEYFIQDFQDKIIASLK